MLESLNYSFRNPKKHNLSNLPHQTVEKLRKNHGVLRGPQLGKQRWRARLGILRVNTGTNQRGGWVGPTANPDNVEKGNKSLAPVRYQTHYMTTISQVLKTTDRTTSEILVPRYIPVHTVTFHTTQSSQRLRENLQPCPVLQDILVYKIFHLFKSIHSSTECLMFTSVVQYMEWLPPSDSASQYLIKSQSKASFFTVIYEIHI